MEAHVFDEKRKTFGFQGDIEAQNPIGRHRRERCLGVEAVAPDLLTAGGSPRNRSGSSER